VNSLFWLKVLDQFLVKVVTIVVCHQFGELIVNLFNDLANENSAGGFLQMVLQKLWSYFFSSELHDMTIQNFPFFSRIIVAFVDIKLNHLQLLFKRLSAIVTIGTMMSSRPSFLVDRAIIIVVRPSTTVLFIVAPLVIIILWEIFMLLMSQFVAAPASTSWIWFCTAGFIHCVWFGFTFVVFDELMVVLILLKVLAWIHVHFLAHELLFTFLFFLHNWIGSAVDTLSIVMLI